MQEIDERIVLLLHKRVGGDELEEEEEVLLEEWLAASPQHRLLLDELMDEPRLDKELKTLMAIDEDAALKTLHEKIARERKQQRWFTGSPARYAAAAMLLLVLGAGMYAWYRSMDKTPADVPPGGDNAQLTLADGSMLVLDRLAEGVISRQPGAIVRKQKDASLAYETAGAVLAGALQTPSYNTLTTARKDQYRVMLPDGSQVWLNAESSIRYATSFAGGQRTLTLLGEAYFDIKPRYDSRGRKIPFTVVTTDKDHERARIEVLGTRFNVRAYADEDTMNTTLLEGKVMLQPAGKDQQPVSLEPGQNAKLSKNGMVALNQPDTGRIAAWKNGFFDFRDTDFATVMRMISRWYDVTIVYDGKISPHTLTGKIERSVPLSKVLQLLELTGDVHFTLRGNTVTVRDAPKS